MWSMQHTTRTRQRGTMKKYFSAWDLQCHDYFHTGRNSNTLKECQEQICNFLLDGEDLTDKYIEKWLENPQDILNTFEVEIHDHEKKLPDDNIPKEI